MNRKQHVVACSMGALFFALVAAPAYSQVDLNEFGITFGNGSKISSEVFRLESGLITQTNQPFPTNDVVVEIGDLRFDVDGYSASGDPILPLDDLTLTITDPGTSGFTAGSTVSYAFSDTTLDQLLAEPADEIGIGVISSRLTIEGGSATGSFANGDIDPTTKGSLFVTFQDISVLTSGGGSVGVVGSAVTGSASVVPEPSSVALAVLGSALAAGFFWRRRRQPAKS